MLEIDEHLADVAKGMSDSTRHHDAMALERLQAFALEHKLLDKPVFGRLEKPRVAQRDRIPTADETAAILANAAPALRACEGVATAMVPIKPAAAMPLTRLLYIASSSLLVLPIKKTIGAACGS